MEYARNIINALNEERTALSSLPSSALLTNGERVREGSSRAYYKFEVPDNFFLLPGMSVKCAVGSAPRFSFPVIVADVHSQFVIFLFPVNMGEQIAELSCVWDPAEITARLNERWLSVSTTPLLEQLVTRSFTDNTLPFTKEPIFPSTFTESQLNALKESLSRRISIVIGERRHGKTGVAAALLFNAIREGKRILYLASSSDGLYHCMNEVVQLNPVVAEESIAIIDAGLDLQPALPVPHVSLEGIVDPQKTEGLKKLFTVIAAEHEYLRAEELQTKIAEKQKQIAEAAQEAEAIKAEVGRLQGMSMIDRMKARNHKALLDETQMKLLHKLALVDRLKQHAATLIKELARKERMLPLSSNEKKAAELFSATTVTFTGSDALRPHTSAKRCVATTLSQALLLDPSLFAGMDIVCLDDAHAFNLPEFFYCASLAGERCYILADSTEQPPQSASQGEPARQWLQKNFFHYIQQDDSDVRRFTAGALPKNIVSELTLPGKTTTIFEALLYQALDGTPLPSSTTGRIHFINTEGQFAVAPQFIGKKKILPYNEVNAKRAAECAKHALMNGTTTQSDVMIVAPPSGQTMYLREHLHGLRMQNVEIVTLGSLRLCSKRAVIFDLTVAGLDFTLRMLDERKIGLVKVADIFNTLLSTAQEDLYVIADLGYFRTRYKGKFIEKLLSAMSSKSENVAAISNASRRFDDLPFDTRKKVLFSSAEEKKSPDYRAKLEQSKPSALDQSSAQQNTVARADSKLKNDIYSASLRVLAKRILINIIAQYLEATPLYKTTAETQKYISILPEYECENENDFKAIMDMWNVLIYETSNARRHAEHPLAGKAKVDSKIASDIQQIYYYYHSDLEMVVEEGKHKLAQSIQKIFNDCIGKKPVTPADWKNAYLIFLNRMEKYLDTIVNQVRV
ncbi:MAG: hypothetical protein ACYC09_01310 [Bacteroidota bacterium]